AAEVLAGGARVRGDRLGIVTNAGGPGVLATDRAIDLGLAIPELESKTISRLDEELPAHWSHGNPVDIIGDAPASRYRAALDAVLNDGNVDGVLVMLTPTALADAGAAARDVVEAAKGQPKPVFACWMGDEQVAEGRRCFTEAGLPHFDTPEAAVGAFAALAAYRRNQQLLLEVPGPVGS